MTSGALRFVRYAYPPNALGYCGPGDHAALFEYGSAGVVDGGLLDLIRDFEGAWPYLELIGRSNGRDPLDAEVVEAYWIGNRLLEAVDATAMGNSMDERFRPRAGSSWDAVAEAVAAGARPSHGFHVFCVYPWVGLMRTGLTDQPLHVLDRCRIRWGRVVGIDGEMAVVDSQLLVLEHDRLALGPSRPERVRWAGDGYGPSGELQPGDRVSMHWDWVCERIGATAQRRLAAETERALRLANRHLAAPRTGVLI